MKHTPGPWHLAADADGTMTTNNQGAQITMWPPQGGTVEQCANARLIAAAPDLLAALQAAAAAVELSTPNGVKNQPPAWAVLPDGQFDLAAIASRARAAIARATGE